MTRRLRRHTLSNNEKLEYINAELCLMKKPATMGLPGAKTRFDELQAIHQLQAYATHHVVSWRLIIFRVMNGWGTPADLLQGGFLPFHRMMMHAHESALRDDCGYAGYQP